MVRYVPKIRQLKLIRTYAGLIPYSSDTQPFVGYVDKVKGFVLDCGHHTGICMSPGTGFLLAQLIAEGKSDIPLDQYDYSRLQSI